ncbi:MAG: SIMPL domain-containing protein [Candidatus Micrarchaeota archaeon]|nr:SIMPL domain-containing protein [Candidatus Micrarchaeota archaeon]
MVSTKEVVHYSAIAVTVFLGLVLLFAFSSLSGMYFPQGSGANQTVVSVGSTGAAGQQAQARLKTISAFGTNYTSKAATYAQLNITSTGYGRTSFAASNALESHISALDSLLSGNGYAGPVYGINVTSYNITKSGITFKANSSISVTILRPSNVSHIIGFIDAIPNTTVSGISPRLNSSSLTLMRHQAAKAATSNASSQIYFYLGSAPTVYSENVIISGLPSPVGGAAAGTSNATALDAALNSRIWLKGTATVNATYSAAPVQNAAIGNSIIISRLGGTARLIPNGIAFITINASGTTPQLATASLNSSLEALNDTISGYINGNPSLISTSDYRVKFYQSSTGPQFYALEGIAVTVPNINNVSAVIGSVPNAQNAYITGVGTGYTGPQAALVQQELTNLISNATQTAEYLAGTNKLYLTSVTVQQPSQAPQVYLNSTTRPGSISINSRIYNQTVFSNSVVAATFEYSNPISSSLRLTTTGIASGIPAQADINVHIIGNGTTGQLAANSLLSTLSQFNSSISTFINRNFTLVTVPNYTVTRNNSRYSAYVDVRVLLPNIANASAVQHALGLLPNTTVTGITPELSQSQLSSLEAQALATAIAQARSQISIVLGSSSAIPQISVISQNFTVSHTPAVVSTVVSSQPVVVPTISEGLNESQSVVATINVTATVSPAAIH